MPVVFVRGASTGPGAPEPAEWAVDVEPANPGPRWRFQSAAPFSGSPAVSPAGLVYVAGVDGYVHALEPDGAFRWSYGVTGIPIGAPAVDATGQVYVATTAQRLYALRPDGHLGWMQRLPTRFATPPVWVSPGLIYYVGRDQNLYYLADWNSEPSRRFLGQPVSAPLSSLGDGCVGLGTAAPDALVLRRSSLVTRLELEGGLLQPLLGSHAHYFAVTRAGLAAFDAVTRAPVWKAPARRAGLSADERTLLVESDGELIWLAPQTGQALYRVPLPDEPSAASLVTNAGVAVVPLVSGVLLVIEPRHGRTARFALAQAPVWPPMWSEQSRRVTAAAAGVVVGLDLSAWSGADADSDSPAPASEPAGGAQRVEPPASSEGGA